MSGKAVKQPGGPWSQERQKIGLPRQIRIDTSRNEILLHDGITAGGHRLVNASTVAQMITEATQGVSAGSLVLFATRIAMAEAVPASDMFAVVTEPGFEDVFSWRPGFGDASTIPSQVDGHWKRVSSQISFVAELWKAGLFNIRLGGDEPDENQSRTLWYDDDALLAWDGDSYEPITDVTFARLIRSYSQLGEQIADLNNVSAGSQYYFGDTAANRPAGIQSGITWANPINASGTEFTQIVIADTAQLVIRHFEANAFGEWIATAIDGSDIVTGTVSLDRLPDYPQAKVTGLATALANIDAGFTAVDAALAVIDGGLTNHETRIVTLENESAPINNPDFTGVPTAPIPGVGAPDDQLATMKNVRDIAGSLDFDPWLMQPVGVIIGLSDNIVGVTAPPIDKAYRYAKLTAADAYNTGILVSESVSGSAPDVTATATVSLVGSPVNGQVLPLINTDRRFLRGGSAGTKEQSQNKSHTHTGSTNNTGAHTHSTGVRASGGPGGTGNSNPMVNNGTTGSAGAHEHTLTINADGGTEARPASLGVTYFIRIK